MFRPSLIDSSKVFQGLLVYLGYNSTLVLVPCCFSFLLHVVVNFICVFSASSQLALLSTLPQPFYSFRGQEVSIPLLIFFFCEKFHLNWRQSFLSCSGGINGSTCCMTGVLTVPGLRTSNLPKIGVFSFTCFPKYFKYAMFLSIRVHCIFILALTNLQSYAVLWLWRIQYSGIQRRLCYIINNNIYLLQLGCHPVAVVILHVHRTWNWLLLNWSREGYKRSM